MINIELFIQLFKYGWVSFWCVYVVLLCEVVFEEFIIFVCVVSCEDVYVVMGCVIFLICLVVDLEYVYYNLMLVCELVVQGVFSFENDCFFEMVWQGGCVVGWVDKLVFVVFDVVELFEVWMMVWFFKVLLGKLLQ